MGLNQIVHIQAYRIIGITKWVDFLRQTLIKVQKNPASKNNVYWFNYKVKHRGSTDLDFEKRPKVQIFISKHFNKIIETSKGPFSLPQHKQTASPTDLFIDSILPSAPVLAGKLARLLVHAVSVHLHLVCSSQVKAGYVGGIIIFIFNPWR